MCMHICARVDVTSHLPDCMRGVVPPLAAAAGIPGGGGYHPPAPQQCRGVVPSPRRSTCNMKLGRVVVPPPAAAAAERGGTTPRRDPGTSPYNIFYLTLRVGNVPFAGPQLAFNIQTFKICFLKCSNNIISPSLLSADAGIII